jgi:ribosomal protein S18 acetylase RimI-like enzyme
VDGSAAQLTFRRSVEADHRRLVAVVDDWWGGRQLAHLLPRLWLQFFTGTSWIAEAPAGALAGFLIGFVRPDDPTIGYVHMIATSPNRRKRGLGRQPYQHFSARPHGRGTGSPSASAWTLLPRFEGDGIWSRLAHDADRKDGVEGVGAPTDSHA